MLFLSPRMAPPNGVPPSTDNGVYMSTTTTTIPQETDNTTLETTEPQTQQQPVVCVNCKQNQKDGDTKETEGLLKEVPNNNVQIIKSAKSNGTTSMTPVKDPNDDDDIEEEADIVSTPEEIQTVNSST